MRCGNILTGCLALLLFAQNTADRIGEIDFFGVRGADIAAVRAALPVREGDLAPTSDEERLRLKDGLNKAVKQTTGQPATDISTVCCDEKGEWMIYIGLAEKPVEHIRYYPRPTGRAALPAAIVRSYHEVMEAHVRAVRKGAGGEDHSRGFSLSVDPELRDRQLAFRQLAIRSEQVLYKALQASDDGTQRAIAANALGYVPASTRQIAALVRAARDSNESVRNNAVRALWVLADSRQAYAAQIPAGQFIPLLRSGNWSDRNKSLLLLSKLSESRDPRLLKILTREALAALIEMAQWRNPSHSDPARILLGRIASIEEERLQAMIRKHELDPIIAAVRAKTAGQN